MEEKHFVTASLMTLHSSFEGLIPLLSRLGELRPLWLPPSSNCSSLAVRRSAASIYRMQHVYVWVRVCL